MVSSIGINYSLLLLSLTAFLILTLSQVLLKSTNDYKAAVVEYHAIEHPPGTPSDTILMENAERYAEFINDLKDDVDLIVFPESTFTIAAVFEKRTDMLEYSTPVPNPSETIDVCESQSRFPQFFSRLACAARDAKVYLVVNLIERKLCYAKSYYGEFRQCSKDSWDLYNTDVVFDRRGRVIARYRKFNLFGEVWLNRTVNPVSSIFKTDFGTNFGLFTCFDIMFKRPAMDLVRLHGVDHIIYPSMWFSELPFLTALQAQMQWAYESDAVLLSAGGNNCLKGSGGSGIFRGQLGAVEYGYPKNGESKAYISTLSKIVSSNPNTRNEDDIDRAAKEMDKFYLMKENLTAYTMLRLDPLNNTANNILCHTQDRSQLCCNFHVETELKNVKDKVHYKYYLVAYIGVRSFENVAVGGLEICGIVACTEEKRESCGERFSNYYEIEWPVTFTKILISANFSYRDTKMQYPNSLLSDIRPLTTDSFEWSHRILENETVIERKYNLIKPQNRLLTFAIFGRDFTKDVNFFH